jgi:hypothetical protein
MPACPGHWQGPADQACRSRPSLTGSPQWTCKVEVAHTPGMHSVTALATCCTSTGQATAAGQAMPATQHWPLTAASNLAQAQPAGSLLPATVHRLSPQALCCQQPCTGSGAGSLLPETLHRLSPQALCCQQPCTGSGAGSGSRGHQRQVHSCMPGCKLLCRPSRAHSAMQQPVQQWCPTLWPQTQARYRW